ncbi:MAG: cell division protein ZapA [Acidobacteriota bacterium]|nr:cell division protein ZapA [Acidobacteriota bacterium]
MATKATTTTDVEIFGAVYHVRGEQNPEHLRELASFVDGRMQDVAGQVATVDTAKIAILAALNIADELSRARKLQEGERVEIEGRVTALAAELEKVLAS